MYSLEQKVKMSAWALTFDNLGETQRKFKQVYKKKAPSKTAISKWKNKLLKTGSLIKIQKGRGRLASVATDDNRQKILSNIANNPHHSIRTISQKIRVSKSSVQRILSKSKIKPYKPTTCQWQHDGDNEKRLHFCQEIVNKIQQNPALLRMLILSDECNFYLSGKINSQNSRFWSKDNPHWRVGSKCSTTRYLTVWAAIGWNGVVGINISDQNMNAARYSHEILDSIVVPYFRRNPTFYFQQDGASAHYAMNVRRILDAHLPNRWLGRRGPTEWPARSPDLTPCDYWLWPYLKSLVYANRRRFNSLDSLKLVIQNEIETIPLEHYRNSMRNFQKRIQECMEVSGTLFEE